jgi:polyribonucleotide nucleotidyltransferase
VRYAAASGRGIDHDALHWWEIMGNLRWAATCHVQAQRHLSGADPSVELASLGRRAVEMVQLIVAEPEVGKIYRGTVRKIMDFGAFVEILPGTDGLVHISQLASERVRRVTDVLNEGDEVMVKVLEIDKQGKIRLSRKEALEEANAK